MLPVLGTMPPGVRRSTARRPVPLSRQPSEPAPTALAPSPTKVSEGECAALFHAVAMRPRVTRSPCSAIGSGRRTTLTTPPSASDPYSTLAGPFTTSSRSASADSTFGEWSCPHCWVSVRWPLARVTTRLLVSPRMTGLPMPVVMESDRMPGICCSVSPSEAELARRSSAPVRRAVGCAMRRASVATAVAVTCSVGSARAVVSRFELSAGCCWAESALADKPEAVRAQIESKRIIRCRMGIRKD